MFYITYRNDSYDRNKNKHRGKDCMKTFCEDLGKNLTEAIKHKKKLLLSKVEKEPYQKTRNLSCMQIRF